MDRNEPREITYQEKEKGNYIKINPSSHPKLFTHLLKKANSITSDQTFSFTCNAKIKGSILHNFHYKNFVLFCDTGATINLIARPHLKHIKYISLSPQNLRITGINKTSSLREYERVSLTLCENTIFEQKGNFYVVDKIGTQQPHREKDIKEVKTSFSFTDIEMNKIYKHFQPKDIQILIGTPLASLFFKEIPPELLGKSQPSTSPNLKFYKTPLMKDKIIIGGKLGIDKDLTPSFLLLHNSQYKLLKIPEKILNKEQIFLTRKEQISLEDFLNLEENKNSPRILCSLHSSAKCTECNRLNNQDSLLDKENRMITEKK